MGDFNRYVDLFKTYGIEYIIIIVFLIAIIFFWRYLSKRPPKKGKKRLGSRRGRDKALTYVRTNPPVPPLLARRIQ